MPSSISMLQRAALVKREAVPYVGETLVAGDGITDLREFGFIEPDFGRLENANMRKTTYGPPKAAFDIGAAVMGVTLGVPVRAPAANGDVPPDLSELLYLCGLKETIAVGVKVDYTPQTPADINLAQTGSMAVYEAGKLHSFVGARGDLVIAGQTGQQVVATINPRAPWLTPTANQTIPTVAAPTGDPLVFSGALAITEDAAAVDIGSFELAMQNALEENPTSNGTKIYIANHVPVIRIDPLAVANQVEWDKITGSTTIQIIADFNGMKLTAPVCKLVEQGSAERTRRITRTRTWELLETAGDDQFTLEFTAPV